jgi:hypothetical protein
VEYTPRLSNGGSLKLPETRVEAMNAPEMFAETPNLAGKAVMNGPYYLHVQAGCPNNC